MINTLDVIDHEALICDIGLNAATLLARLLPDASPWVHSITFNPPSTAEHLGLLVFQAVDGRWWYAGFSGVETKESDSEREWVRTDKTGMEPE